MDPMLPLYTDKCKCNSCGEYFNSTYAFERHRAPRPYVPIGQPSKRRCLTVEELTGGGWGRNSTGHWITSKRPASRGGAQ